MEYIVKDTTFSSIAQAIRDKTGENKVYTPIEMPDAIASIEGGGSDPVIDVPIPEIEDDYEWVMPESWPDLDSLVLDDTAQEIYLLFDKSLIPASTTSIAVLNSHYVAATTTRGHIEAGQYIVDHTYSSDTIDLTEIEDNLFLVKVENFGEDVLNGNTTKKYIIASVLNNNKTQSNSFGLGACPQIVYVRMANKSKISTQFFFNQDYRLRKVVFEKDNIVTNFNGLFSYDPVLTKVDLSNLDTSNVTSMDSMFKGCTSLKEIKFPNNFITNKCTGLGYMFQDCNSLQKLELPKCDTSNVSYMGSMFSGCYSLQEVKFSENFVTNKCTNLNNMFNLCRSLQKLDLSDWDTSNVTTVDTMFSDCCSLQEIKFPKNFVTNKCTSIGTMFQNCYSLKKLDLSDWDTSNIKSFGTLFANCYFLQEIKFPKNFVTNKCTSIGSVFSSCQHLQKLDLSDWDTSNVSIMGSSFNNCSSLKELNINGWDFSKVTSQDTMFGSLNCLQILNIGNFKMVSSGLFGYSNPLPCIKELDLSQWDTSQVKTVQLTSGYAWNSLQKLNIKGWTFESATSCRLFEQMANIKEVIFPDVGLPECFAPTNTLFGNGTTRKTIINFFNALAPLTTSRTLKLKSDLRYKLTDADLAIAQDKGYTITFAS